MGIIHQEQEGLVVLGKVSGRDVLPVAGVVGERQRALVDRPDEAFRAAAVLRIGLTQRVAGGEIGGIDLGQEGDQSIVDDGSKAAARLHAGIGRARAPRGLRRLDRRGEGDVAGDVGHGRAPIEAVGQAAHHAPVGRRWTRARSPGYPVD